VVLITAGAPKIREKMLSGKSCSKEIREFKWGCSTVVLITAVAPEALRKHALREVLLLAEILG
jgi:hypothetical protein